ncbi:MAG: transglycosylase SLT domain-containing protein [Parvularculaceae bacterium]
MRNGFNARWIAVFSGILLLAAASINAADAAMMTPRLKPPAPGPAYMSRADLERIRTIRDSLSRKRYSSARALIDLVEDPTAKTLAQWYYFDAQDPDVSVTEADAYLDANPDWPSTTKIQMHVEGVMTSATPASTVLAFFDTRDPLTGGGKLQLARAQFSAGSPEAGVFQIKDAWINNNFRLADEQRLLAQYGGRLTPEDHIARVDRLLWSREVTNARRVFSRLPSAERRKAEVRAELLMQTSGAQRAYDNLKEHERADAGVMLAAIRHFRRADEEMRAIAITRAAPLDPVERRNPARWWDEQQLLMRWALKNRQYADAYAMAAMHGLEPGTGDFAEAEFDAGWIALRFLGDPDRALTHFAALTASVGAPISLSRGWYWMARAAEARGDADKAAAWYRNAAGHPYTFYGQLAAEKLGPTAMSAFREAPPATAEEKAKFGARPAVGALRMLTDVGDERAFLIFSYNVDDSLESRGEFLELANLALRMGAPHVAVRAGKVAVRAGSFAPQVAYPEIYVPEDATRFTPAEIILGLSRQESEFNPRAYSRAGARGMMQLIPSTAQITARKEGLPYRRSALLDDPIYNMTLGAAHLSHLLERYDGSYIMTFAAYNAGPHRVTQWIEAYGDPRGGAIDPLDWIEQIPFGETRNYVQRVLENTQIYRSRISGGPIAGRLAADIERGGAPGRVGATPALDATGMLPPLQARIADIADPLVNPPPPPEPVVEAIEEARAEEAQPGGRGSRRPFSRSRRSDAAETTDAPRPVLTVEDAASAADGGAAAPIPAAATTPQPAAYTPSPAESEDTGDAGAGVADPPTPIATPASIATPTGVYIEGPSFPAGARVPAGAGAGAGAGVGATAPTLAGDTQTGEAGDETEAKTNA